MEVRFQFDNPELFRSLCGIADGNVPSLERILDVQLIPRGNGFLIQAQEQKSVELATRLFERISHDYDHRPRHRIEEFDLKYIYSMLQKKEQNADGSDITYLPDEAAEGSPDLEEQYHNQNGGQRSRGLSSGPMDQTDHDDMEPSEALDSTRQKVYVTARGKPIYPRTHRQAAYLESIQKNPVTICLGPAGTGKTFLAIVMACRKLLDGDVDRIILTRPAVEAGESLGFLPGDLNQKVDPYLRPVYDALYECLGMEKVHSMIAARKIEIAPLAYMRGRTLNQAMVVLDEAQNCTLAQIKMFLTRLGRNSFMCLGGDETQVDLNPGKSGLLKAVRILERVSGVSVVRFGKEDIVRNPIVERIVAAFEEEESEG
jgi:phosphate starvation-inducible PhoH-like protein|tara:strand:- start:6235 stop:7350 length:1116 start_codon:yes stop_codon:yes gene_type:complete